MPVAVTAILSYATGIAATATSLIVAGYVIVGVAVVAYGQSQRRKAKRKAIDAYNASLSDRLVMTALANGRRSRVYGRVRNVDGVVFKQTHGTNSEFYTFVISLAGHEVDAIETVYFNDVALTLDGSGYVTTAPWAGSKVVDGTASVTVTAGSGSVTLANTPIGGSVTATSVGSGALDEQSYSLTPSVSGSDVTISGAPVNGAWLVNYQYTQNTPKARVRKYLGGASQNLYTDLSATVGTSQLLSTDNFAGDASLIVTLEYDQDAFPTGVPQVSAVIRGAKVYDPRNGTTAWSENTALIARDWALYSYGGGASSDELIEASFTTAANACDVSTSFVTDAGTEVRPLYQCGIVCPLDADPSETLNEIVESMAGKFGWAGGKLTVRAGAYRAPVAAIDSAWITNLQAIEVIAQTATADLVNVMRPTLADAAQDYVPVPAAEVRYTAAITADGREMPREVDFNGVTRAVHAQHICGVLMREGREGLTVRMPCNLRAMQLELFDVVTVTLSTFGWSAKEFEVLGWEFSPENGVILTLRETAAAIFDPDTLFTTLDIAANTGLPKPDVVEQITGVTVTSGTSTELDKSIVVRTTVSWTAATTQQVRQSGTIEVQYFRAGQTLPTGDWPSVTVPGNSTSATIVGLGQGLHYVFRVRAVTTLGVRGIWSVLKNAQVAAVPTVGTTGISASAATAVRTTTASSVSVTGYGRVFTGGSPPFTIVDSWTTVVSDTFTPTVNCEVEITVDGYADFTPGSSVSTFDHPACVFTLCYTLNAGSETSKNSFDQQATVGVAYKVPVKYSRRVSLTGGASSTIAFRVQKGFDDDTMDISEIEMRLTVIYR
jgi:hypothetical protein